MNKYTELERRGTETTILFIMHLGEKSFFIFNVKLVSLAYHCLFLIILKVNWISLVRCSFFSRLAFISPMLRQRVRDKVNEIF